MANNIYAASALKLNDTYVNTLPYGVCTGSGSQFNASVGDFALEVGALVVVSFTNKPTSRITLNINNTGDIPVYNNNSNEYSHLLRANQPYLFIYYGNRWNLIDGSATSSDITGALGYTPADEDDTDQLYQIILKLYGEDLTEDSELTDLPSARQIATEEAAKVENLLLNTAKKLNTAVLPDGYPMQTGGVIFEDVISDGSYPLTALNYYAPGTAIKVTVDGVVYDAVLEDFEAEGIKGSYVSINGCIDNNITTFDITCLLLPHLVLTDDGPIAGEVSMECVPESTLSIKIETAETVLIPMDEKFLPTGLVIEELEAEEEIPSNSSKLYRYKGSDPDENHLIEVVEATHESGDGDVNYIYSNSTTNGTEIKIPRSLISTYYPALASAMTVTAGTNLYTLRYTDSTTGNVLDPTGIRLGSSKNTGSMTFTNNVPIKVLVGNYYSYNGSTGQITYDTCEYLVDGSMPPASPYGDETGLTPLAFNPGEHTITTQSGRLLFIAAAVDTSSGESHATYTSYELARRSEVAKDIESVNTLANKTSSNLANLTDTVNKNTKAISKVEASVGNIQINDATSLPAAKAEYLKSILRYDHKLYECTTVGDGVQKEFLFNLPGTSEITDAHYTGEGTFYKEIKQDFDEYLEVLSTSKVYRNNDCFKLGSSSATGMLELGNISGEEISSIKIGLKAYKTKAAFNIACGDISKTVIATSETDEYLVAINPGAEQSYGDQICIETVASLENDEGGTITYDKRGYVTRIILDFGDISYEWQPLSGGSEFQLPVTYSELKALRDNSELIPGMYYRITDYQCTTIQENTRSANHQFDIIIQALDTDTLSENARADHHDADPYFDDNDANLAAWELKYSLDNDTSRFAWADEENGKGVIYWMKDEHNNECPYDFKNIQYKRWKGNIITEGSAKYADIINLYNYFGPDYYDDDYLMDRAQTYYDTLRSMTKNKISDIGGLLYSLGLRDGYIKVGQLSVENPTLYNYLTDGVNYSLSDDAYIVSTGYHDDEDVSISYMVIDNSVDYWFYTFSEGTIDKSTGGFSNITDSSIISEYVYGNELKVYTFYRDVEKLSANVFLGNSCYSNIFGNDCYSNTFGENCNCNTFGNDCFSNIFGHSCNSNIFGDLCYSNIVGNGSHIRFSGGCYYNTFGNSCSHNVFGNSCYSNIFGNDCRYNIFGDNCDSNIFGEHCYSNKFGYTCYSNIFGNDCRYNIFGDNCDSNIFGEHCNSNTFGNDCFSNIFIQSAADDSEPIGFAKYIRFAEGCNYIKLINAEIGSNSKYVQDITISTGIRGTEYAYRELQVSRNAAPVVFEAANTTHIILD